MLTKTYRVRIPNEIILLNFKGFVHLVTNSYKKGDLIIKQFEDGKTFEIVKKSDEVIDLFDISILHAMHTMYIKNNGIVKFKAVHLLKLISGNKKAHFCKDKVKSTTIGEQDILASLIKWQKFEITKINGIAMYNSKILDIKIQDGYINFLDKPLLVELLDRKHKFVNAQSYSIKVLDFNRIRKTGYYHQSKRLIKFKFLILHYILSDNKKVSISNEVLAKELEINLKLKQCAEQFRSGVINYDLFRKRTRNIKYYFHEKIKIYLDNLKELGVISQFNIFDYVTNIDL